MVTLVIMLITYFMTSLASYVSTASSSSLIALSALALVLAAIVYLFTKNLSVAFLTAAALVGALVGFLWYNSFPAQIFMGDTGSLFLGGMVCGMAFALDMPLILILVGIIYLCETLSVIMQVTYFKLTHGKRFFKMAPLHHHLELSGWSEAKLVAVFSLVTLAGCVLAYLGVMDRFGA